jgi:putative endonuclease
VDLIFKSAQGRIVLVEVKSLSSWDFFSHRISQKQKLRLIRALQYYQAKGQQCLLHYAVVSRDSAEIRVFTDFFG